ncbi:MAG: cytochrome c biogenesis protein CcdA, partial [Alphaproteobacteria bacterium]
MSALTLAFLAGVMTTLNPCVLPVLPVIVASAFVHGPSGPIVLAGGMVASFTLLGTMLASTGAILGIPDSVIRNAAAILFIGFGLVLLSKALSGRLSGALQPISQAASQLAARTTDFGLGGLAITGALLGLVWTPCAGPAFGAAVTLASQSGGFGPAMLRMFVFSIGAAVILVAIALGSREAFLARRDRMMKVAAAAQPALGILLLMIGTAVLTGLDKRLEAAIVVIM